MTSVAVWLVSRRLGGAHPEGKAELGMTMTVNDLSQMTGIS